MNSLCKPDLDNDPQIFEGFTRIDVAIEYSANTWNITFALNNLKQ